MNWFEWAILGSVLIALYIMSTKLLLDEEGQDPFLCAVVFRIVAAVAVWLLIFLLSIDMTITYDLASILVFLGGTVLFTVGNMVTYKSFQLIEVSDMSLIGATQPFFVFMFGAAIFGEFLTWQKVLSVGLCFAGIVSIYWRRNRISLKLGHKLTLLGTMCFALGSFADKYLSTRLDPMLYVAVGMTTTLVTIAIAAQVKVSQTIAFFRGRQGLKAIQIGLLMLFGTVCLMKAFSLGAEASKISLTLYLNTILVVLMGLIFLKEHERALQKIMATVLIFAGLFLIY